MKTDIVKRRLAIITTHPIQYNVPLFRLLGESNSLEVMVFYTWGEAVLKDKFDPGFERTIEWDIPLLSGYNYTFVKNVSAKPGSHHFSGIINPGLIADIHSFKPDAILIYGWSFNSHLKALRHFSNKVPILFRGDSTLLDEPKGISLKKSVRRFFLTWVYKHVDFALYAGENNKHYFLRHGIKQEQLFFAPHAIDMDFFKDDNKDFNSEASKWRKRLGIGEGEIVFLFAGKLEEKKNCSFLINSFLKFKKAECRLILVGNGILESELKNLANGDSRVIFIDFQNQSTMPTVYRLGDVFILPSKGPGESWGLAVNEAMACAKPVLVSNKAGCAIDLVKDGVNGFAFLHSSQNDLLEKLNIFYSRNKQLETMGRNSFDMIQKWDFKSTVSTIESILDKIILR